MLCAQRWSEAGPAGRVIRCWQVLYNDESPKQGSKKINSIMKTIPFAHLVILCIYVCLLFKGKKNTKTKHILGIILKALSRYCPLNAFHPDLCLCHGLLLQFKYIVRADRLGQSRTLLSF